MNATRFEGLLATSKVIRLSLDKAEEKKPRRMTKKMRRSAAYWQGYYEGLLEAHCQMALAEFPESNTARIREILTTP